MDPQPSQSNRDELIVGLKDLVKSLHDRPRGRRWLGAWLNTPIIVTCLGGIAVAWVTSGVQQRADTAAREREQIRVVRSTKLAVFKSFADDFPITHSRLYDLRCWFHWLREHKQPDGDPATNPAVHATGKTYAQALQHWYELKAEYVTSRSFHSMIGQVQASFDDAAILKAAGALEASMTQLFYATEAENIRDLNQQANDLYTSLVGLMADDLRSLSTKENDE